MVATCVYYVPFILFEELKEVDSDNTTVYNVFKWIIFSIGIIGGIVYVGVNLYLIIR